MEEKIEIRNATINSTMLGVEDHGIMTFNLNLDYGNLNQGAGGYALDQYDETQKKRVGSALGMEMIMQLMKVVGVEKWEDLKGKNIRVQSSWNKVHAIGHFLKDEWLDFGKFGR